MSAVHLNDSGITFKITIKDEDSNVIDVSNATSLFINFKKPDGTILSKPAILFTDGTDGIIYYITNPTDLNLSGLWSLQANVVTSTSNLKTNIYDFRVERNVT